LPSHARCDPHALDLAHATVDQLHRAAADGRSPVPHHQHQPAWPSQLFEAERQGRVDVEPEVRPELDVVLLEAPAHVVAVCGLLGDAERFHTAVSIAPFRRTIGT